jgi:hypothetical protein
VVEDVFTIQVLLQSGGFLLMLRKAMHKTNTIRRFQFQETSTKSTMHTKKTDLGCGDYATGCASLS